MKVYFLRHGESVYNVLKKHHHEGVALTEKGKSQAIMVAKKIKPYSIDIILSSHFKRASETAKIIAKEINKKVEYVNLFHEIITPKELWGKKHNSPEALRIKTILKKKFNDPNFHYSNEENFFDALKRAKSVWDYLTKREENNILIITHDKFLKVLIYYLLFGDSLGYSIDEQSSEVFKFNNASITICEKSWKDKWKLINWNG